MGGGFSHNYPLSHPGPGNFIDSQPFKAIYRLPKDRIENDIQDGLYDSKKGYSTNPNAVPIDQAIQGDRVFFKNGKAAHGRIPYVLTEDGRIIFGQRDRKSRKRSPHPTLIGGRNPKVQCAGMMDFRKGKIVSIDNDSGHYKPNIKSLRKVYEVLDKLPKGVFHKKFKKGL